MRGPLERYEALARDGALTPDAAQRVAAARLDALSREVAAWRPHAFRMFSAPPAAPRGLYIWGAVGRGKSLLMDIFFNNTEFAPKRRAHFHAFMIETHERINAFRALGEAERRRAPGADRKKPDDPVPVVARAIAQSARLLCFDEFQVADIADAMLLGRLFEALFAEGVVVVATSNRHPDDLYKDGINRQLFLPFISMLKERLETIELIAARDYRLERLSGQKTYFSPLGPDADAAMDEAWRRVIAGAQERRETMTVKGRTIEAPRVARGAARFSFADLCEKSLGAADYIALCGLCDTLFLDRVPKMDPSRRNEAKRFVTLVDALYESRTRLVMSAEAPPRDLYAAGDGAFEFERTASRLFEMQSSDYLSSERLIAGSGGAA
jgi:cell division protein ZapE